jgi:uncharacterized membrane protein
MDSIPAGSKSFVYTGVIDINGFLNQVKSLLSNLGYTVAETKFEQSSDKGKNNYNTEWAAEKILDDYMKFSVSIKIQIKGVSDTTLMKDNVPTTVKTGTINLSATGSLLLDYEDKWSTGIMKILRPLFDKINEEQRNERIKKLQQDIDSLINALKSSYQ